MVGPTVTSMTEHDSDPELFGDQTRGIVLNPLPPPGDRPPSYRATMIARQQAAGEEDQTVPGWDQGA